MDSKITVPCTVKSHSACGGQVMLLPNFVSTVTREIYQSADSALDTIDLLEQVRSRPARKRIMRSGRAFAGQSARP